jgi:hypothetical protein
MFEKISLAVKTSPQTSYDSSNIVEMTINGTKLYTHR